MKQPRFSLVPQLDHSQRWVSFAQTLTGTLVIIALFACLLFLHSVSLWWLISLYLLAFSLWPGQRWPILLLSTLSFLLIGPIDIRWDRITAIFSEAGMSWKVANTPEGIPLIGTAILFISFCVWLARKFSKQLQRPVLALTTFYLGLMVIASYAPLPQSVLAFMWAFITVLSPYFWYLCYSLKETRSPAPKPLYLQLGHYLPFWSPASIPYPKGTSYLKKIEAKTTEQFAICRLKGLKLLIWALWLSIFALAVNVIFYGYGEYLFGRLQFKRELGSIQLFFDGNHLKTLFTLPFETSLPRYEVAFRQAALGNPLPWYLNSFLTIAHFLYDLLYVAFTTHIIIAIIRMCGFNALRNTYRPLASKSIAEFWNRYYYYFKELLVEFFFYPVFFRYFKKNPKLRMYAATMAAAFFGNFLFHFMRDIWFVVELGFFEALAAFHTYFIYSFVLGNVIFLSQARLEKTSQQMAGPVSRFFAPVRVLGFYCLLTIFVDFRRESISDNISFLMSLFPF